jgi:hypothetical protein
MRLALSMKQLQADPLLETLDTLMPVEAQEGTLSTDSVVLDAELLATALPGLEQICAEMLQEEGYNFVSLLKNLCAVDFKVKLLVFLYSEMVHKRNG